MPVPVRTTWLRSVARCRQDEFILCSRDGHEELGLYVGLLFAPEELGFNTENDDLLELHAFALVHCKDPDSIFFRQSIERRNGLTVDRQLALEGTDGLLDHLIEPRALLIRRRQRIERGTRDELEKRVDERPP